jgi:hypothetical protein
MFLRPIYRRTWDFKRLTTFSAAEAPSSPPPSVTFAATAATGKVPLALDSSRSRSSRDAPNAVRLLTYIDQRGSSGQSRPMRSDERED